jgi:hypothetical protein
MLVPRGPTGATGGCDPPHEASAPKPSVPKTKASRAITSD